MKMGELLAKFESQDDRHHDKDAAAVKLANEPAMNVEPVPISAQPAEAVVESEHEKQPRLKTRGTKRPR